MPATWVLTKSPAGAQAAHCLLPTAARDLLGLRWDTDVHLCLQGPELLEQASLFKTQKEGAALPGSLPALQVQQGATLH